ncbi:MAG: 4'-phosphopantetheinyl transferase superfamily protein [Prevotella sp.]|nr:4'-phosphopantetheinyl transferase superfamily protein [Prevotella sp.]
MIYLSEDIYGFDLPSALTLVSEQRRQQALRFRHELGRRLCVLAYRLLQQGLSREYGIDVPPIFGYGPHGKPYILDHPEIHFSLSHCREAALCVLSDRPVGADVESIRSYSPSLLRHTMCRSEIGQIESSAEPERTFIRLWTMKEACLKLSGRGIVDTLPDVLAAATCNFATTEAERYIYTVASEGGTSYVCQTVRPTSSLVC